MRANAYVDQVLFVGVFAPSERWPLRAATRPRRPSFPITPPSHLSMVAKAITVYREADAHARMTTMHALAAPGSAGSGQRHPQFGGSVAAAGAVERRPGDYVAQYVAQFADCHGMPTKRC